MTSIEIFEKTAKELDNLHIPYKIQYNCLWCPFPISPYNTIPSINISFGTDNILYYTLGITSENIIRWFKEEDNVFPITEANFHTALSDIINYYCNNIEKYLDK